jgi:hypothetical protein
VLTFHTVTAPVEELTDVSVPAIIAETPATAVDVVKTAEPLI